MTRPSNLLSEVGRKEIGGQRQYWAAAGVHGGTNRRAARGLRPCRNFLAWAPINQSFGENAYGQAENSLAAPSRRRVIKGALAAGIAAPAILRITSGVRRLSGTAGADHRRQHAGRPVRHHRPHHGGGDAAGDGRHLLRREPRRRRRQYRHGACRALRSRRLHHPADDQRLFGQSRALQNAALRSVQGFRRDLRARDLAACVRGQARTSARRR